MSTKPQTAAVLRLLRVSGTLGVTPNMARDRVGTDRLAARVAELRADGYNIETTYVTLKRASGATTRYARYILHDPSDLQSSAATTPAGALRRNASGAALVAREDDPAVLPAR